MPPRFSHPEAVTAPPPNHVIAPGQQASVFVGRCEYILGSDGAVQHRLAGNTTFLNCRDAQHPTPDEKIALQKLLAMEAERKPPPAAPEPYLVSLLTEPGYVGDLQLDAYSQEHALSEAGREILRNPKEYSGLMTGNARKAADDEGFSK
jgi:hypothetical protein